MARQHGSREVCSQPPGAAGRGEAYKRPPRKPVVDVPVIVAWSIRRKAAAWFGTKRR
jgi:hypothetical protein